jgi:hypothetical protein
MTKTTLLAIAFMAMVTFNIQAQNTEIVLTQSTGEIFIANGVSCDGGDNSWYREYMLSDEGITTDVKLVGVEFGLQGIQSDEVLEVYAYNFEGFPAGFNAANPPTPIASGRVTVGLDDIDTIIRVDFDSPALVSASSSIVVSVVQPTSSGNQLFLGATPGETKGGFISSIHCGIEGEPLPVATIGYPDARHMINLVVVDETLSLSNSQIEKFAIYPNPTSARVMLKAPSGLEVINVNMFDALGKNLHVQYRNEIVETDNLSPGVYLLQVDTSHGSFTKKIVKQ